MDFFKMAGLLATDVKVLPETWASFIDECLRSRNGASTGLPKDSCELRDLLGHNGPAFAEAMAWLGILPSNLKELTAQKCLYSDLPSLPKQPTAPIDIFATLLAHKLRYLPRGLASVPHPRSQTIPPAGCYRVASGVPQSLCPSRSRYVDCSIWTIYGF